MPEATGPDATRSAVPRPAPRPARFPNFDAHRAFGILMIFGIHADFASIAHDKGYIGRIVSRFDLAVGIFFTLSAFLLFRPYIAAQLAKRPSMSLRTFYRHRVLRIFPAYWFALIALVVVFGMKFKSLVDVVIYALLLQNYTSNVFAPRYQMIYQAWSLGTEVTFYLLLPLFALWIRRRVAQREPGEQLRFVLVVCAAAFMAGVAYRAFLVTASPSWQQQGIVSMPAWLDFFALGVALAAISAWIEHTQRDFPLVSWLGRHPGMAWAGAAAVFVVATLFRPGPNPLQLNGTEYIARYALYTVVALLFLAPATFGNQYEGWIRRGLRSRALVWMGTVSLGFYLFHVAIIDRIQVWFDYPPFEASFLVLLAVGIPLSFLAASLSFYVIERPFLRMKSESWNAAWSRATRRLRPTAPGTG